MPPLASCRRYRRQFNGNCPRTSSEGKSQGLPPRAASLRLLKLNLKPELPGKNSLAAWQRLLASASGSGVFSKAKKQRVTPNRELIHILYKSRGSCLVATGYSPFQKPLEYTNVMCLMTIKFHQAFYLNCASRLHAYFCS